MANEYRTWLSTSTANFVVKLDSFLVNTVGWYRTFTHSDTGSNATYTWISEGETSDDRPARLISIEGTGSNIKMDCLMDGFNFVTGDFGSLYLGSSNVPELRAVTTPGQTRSVANKDRIWFTVRPTITNRLDGYVGFIESFYQPEDDPYPYVIKGQITATVDWRDAGNTVAISAANTEGAVALNFNELAMAEGDPNPRSGEFSFWRPLVYNNLSPENYEVRGKLIGGLYTNGRLGSTSFVKINDDYHLVSKTADELGAMVWGPVSANGQLPTTVINAGFPTFPLLNVDYNYRGLEIDTAVSGTLALWRFDTGHLSSYVYGSGNTLPVPSIYEDELSNYNLTPQNGMTSVESRLREAADFDGSGDYCTNTGDSTLIAALKEQWTLEMLIKPDTIPTGSNESQLFLFGSPTSGSEDDNSLLSLTITEANGTTPDEFNIERGNLKVLWQRTASNINVSSESSLDFIQQNRWNYIAIVKRFNGSLYDLEVWHCSYGDHLVPVKRLFVQNVQNATGGTNGSLFIGRGATATKFYNGKIDDTRLTQRPLTEEEIQESCLRAML